MAAQKITKAQVLIYLLALVSQLIFICNNSLYLSTTEFSPSIFC